MKTVLVVAYHYPPEEGSCSEKNARIIKKLIDSGYNVIVVTKAYKNFNSIEKKNDIDILRTINNGIFHKVSSGECPQNGNVTNLVGIKARLKKFVSNNMIPDSVIDWIPQVKKLYNDNSELLKRADIILSISSPYSAHLASHYLAEQLGIPYIMCYGDPWIYEPKRKRGKIRYNYEKRMEKKLIDDASKVLLITEWNKAKYQKLYSVDEDKVYTYHIGYDEKETLEGIHPLQDGNLKVIYGGSLDKVHRNPKPFIEAMTKIDGVKAYIYNSDNEDIPKLIDEYKVQDKIVLMPIVGTNEFYHKLYEMDVLLLFGNRTPFQVPGKVFTYISTRKGILYIKNNEFDNDGTENVLKDYGNAITIRNLSDEIVSCLEKMKKNLETGVTIHAKQFEFHNTMHPIVEAIEAVLNS